MSCFHPLKGFVLGEKSNGKNNIKIYPYSIHHLESRNGIYYPVSMEFVSPYADAVVRDFLTIPCGNCLGCRIQYSRDWATRLVAELGDHDSAYFCTFTYNDEHLPLRFYGDPDNGDPIPIATLQKRDFQLFMKRLRKKFGDGIKFYASGEYGDENYRPHYHAIIYGLKLDDLELLSKNEIGQNYYRSKSLESVWTDKNGDPIGFVVVADVTWQSCAYVARYVMKKLKGQAAEFYDIHNIDPPFSLMSRRPGIGRNYYEENKEKLLDYQSCIFSTDKGGKKYPIPKYFLNRFEVDFPEEYVNIKKSRKERAEEAVKIKMEKTDLDYLSMLAVEEENLRCILKGLKERKVNNYAGNLSNIH